jgi:hypothetical protein
LEIPSYFSIDMVVHCLVVWPSFMLRHRQTV